MTTKLLRSVLLLLVGLCFSIGSAWAQSGTIKGHVTNANTNEPLISANIFIQELTRGAGTDVSGNFTLENIPYGTYKLRVTYIGYETKIVNVTVDQAAETVNITLQPTVGTLDELVVTALGGVVQKRAVSSASQTVKTEDLAIAPNTNIKTSLAGKVAGIQVLGQAGSKLGQSGSIRIRGEVSLTAATTDPLYVIDGVPVGSNPNIVDMNNVAEVTVLKGANATALYGQRGENGVILITTKLPSANGVSVEVNSSLTFQEVYYALDFQNEYGGGYQELNCADPNGPGGAATAPSEVGECGMKTFVYDPAKHPDFFQPLDGMRMLTGYLGDASWGPKLDGKGYAAWYTWWPDSPYYGKPAPYTAKPNNIANFYERGVIGKNNIAINLFRDDIKGRISYTNLQQNGITPYTDLGKHYLAANVGYDVTDDFHVDVDLNYTTEKINGQVYQDGYSNNTTGSFNQWFHRQVSIEKMKELQNLKTPSGYYTSWNWWGPDSYMTDADHQKPVFWFNPYMWQSQFNQNRNRDNLLISFKGNYQLTEQFELQASASTYQTDDSNEWYLPYSIENSSAHSLYVSYVNSFATSESERRSNNYSAQLKYRSNYGDWTFDGLAGGHIRALRGSFYSISMSRGNYESGGLIIPNVYQFSNSAEALVPSSTNFEKRVYSLYGKLMVGYQDFLYLTGTYRQDWSSALPENANGYGYPSLGASFVFSEFINADFLSYGRIRLNWAQTGDDVGSERIIQNYQLSSVPYSNPVTGASIPLLYSANVLVDPNIKPSLSSSFEAGFDTRFMDGRFGLTMTYYKINHKDEIIPISISSTTGRSSYLTNAGATERNGLELVLDGYLIRNNSFQWNMQISAETGETIVNALPAGLDVFTVDLPDDSDFGFVYISMVKGEEWGQLRGTGFKRDAQGRKIVNPTTGLYVSEPNKNLGSILPDYTGGIINSFRYKNFNLSFSINFGFGGSFFSLSEQWGSNTGLMASTAGKNDKGNPKRNPVADGGGVHVTGVDDTGASVDMYVEAKTYFKQFFGNRLAEQYVHSRDFVKLREVNLSYTLPANLFGGAIKRATVGVVARNLFMIYTNNPYGWDPSIFPESYGENSQLPGLRSYGFNINLTF